MLKISKTDLIPQTHPIWQLDAELGVSRGSPMRSAPCAHESLLLLAGV